MREGKKLIGIRVHRSHINRDYTSDTRLLFAGVLSELVLRNPKETCGFGSKFLPAQGLGENVRHVVLGRNLLDIHESESHLMPDEVDEHQEVLGLLDSGRERTRDLNRGVIVLEDNSW